MAIHKKSLITNLSETKKAVVANNAAKAISVNPATKSMAKMSLAKKSPAIRALGARHPMK